MFREAQEQTNNLRQAVYAELDTHISHLNRTASSWFEDSSASVAARQNTLAKAAALCKRIASFGDDNADMMHAMADNLYTESSALMPVLLAVRDEEFTADHDAPIFSSAGFSDESRTGAVNTNDWHLFMSTEPKLFVEANASAAHDAEEMRIRAANFMDDNTTGHGLKRSAKMELTTEFLARVESHRVSAQQHNNGKREAKATVEFSDSALFF